MTKFPDLTELIHGINSNLEGIVDSAENSAFGSAAPEPTAKYVLVNIGSRNLAIAIDNLSEVGSIPKITGLPNLPQWIKGIMNIRSEIISLIDFSGFLGEDQSHNRRDAKLVVLRSDKMKVGMGVDAIVGTVTSNVSDVKKSDLAGESAIGRVIFAEQLPVDKEVYFILNVEKMLAHPRLVNFSEET